LQINEAKRFLSFQLASPTIGPATVRLAWSSSPQLTITDGAGRVLHRDLPDIGYSFEGTRAELALDEQARGRQGGLCWYTSINLQDLCLGLGEKCAPLNLVRRRFSMDTTNAALYDAFKTDPLYKSLPFLLSVPSPRDPVRQHFAKTSESVRGRSSHAQLLTRWLSQTRRLVRRSSPALSRPLPVPPTGISVRPCRQRL
jgi:alpha-glucosidase (family GH31 glycosyl hydrolase)